MSIHVWQADLDADFAGHDCGLWLDRAEWARAGRLRFAVHRNRFMAGRSFLRAVLSRYAGASPGELRFEYGPAGKPVLASSAGQDSVHFNLSHSEQVAVLAVCASAAVGIDVEQVRPFPEMELLAERFFSPREAAAFSRRSGHRRTAAFYRLWTRKEAWLKATGQGLGVDLKSVEVSFGEEEPARLLRVPPGHGMTGEWNLRALDLGPGLAGAVAWRGPNFVVNCRRWPGPDHDYD